VPARFAFVPGPESADREVNVAYGITFPAGVPVEVSDPFVIRKLRGNRFWREVPEADEDGDGELSRDELIAEAERRGIEVDRRWGVRRLREAVGA
jgi:hypothetical protein